MCMKVKEILIVFMFLLHFYKDQGLGVICAAAAAMGLLTNNGALPWHIAPEEIKNQGRLCADYCKSHGIELGKLAIWYAAQLKGPATFLVGMASVDIVDINLDSFLNGLTLKEKEVLDYCLKKYVQITKTINCVFLNFYIYIIFCLFVYSFCNKKGHWEGVELAKLRAAKK